MRNRGSRDMWEALERMEEAGIPRNTQTYTLMINRYVESQNLEMAMQLLFEMVERKLVPELKTAQSVILLAAQLNAARLALDLARAFEAASVRKLNQEVWLNCLTASAQEMYVSVDQNIYPRHSV
jgi:pentatricopeptide repeat protein